MASHQSFVVRGGHDNARTCIKLRIFRTGPGSQKLTPLPMPTACSILFCSIHPHYSCYAPISRHRTTCDTKKSRSYQVKVLYSNYTTSYPQTNGIAKENLNSQNRVENQPPPLSRPPYPSLLDICNHQSLLTHPHVYTMHVNITKDFLF